MALDDLMAALNAGSKNAKERNGYFTARDALSGFQFQPSRKERETGKTDWKKQLMGMMGVGLLGGVLDGLGQRKNMQDEQSKAMRLNMALNSDNPSGMLVGDPELAPYALPLQMEQYKQKQAQNLAREDAALKLEYGLKAQGITQDPKGGYSVDPNMLGAITDVSRAQKGLPALPKNMTPAQPDNSQYGQLMQKALQIQAQTGSDMESAIALAQKQIQMPYETTDALRNEFKATPEYKEYSSVATGYKSLLQAVKDPSSVADQELVRGAIQMIEPGMAVREGEQAAVAASQAIPEQLKGLLAKTLRGEAALGPDVRAGIIALANRRYGAQRDRYMTALEKYQEQAKIRGGNPDAVSFLSFPQPVEGGPVTQLPQQRLSAQNVIRPGAPRQLPPPNPGETREQYRARMKSMGM